MVQNFIAGGAAVNQLCRIVDADLRVYEMNLDTPTGDITAEPAMSEEECAKAMAYGMMAVEPGIDALALGEMGIGNTTSAAALCAASVRRRRGAVDRARDRASPARRWQQAPGGRRRGRAATARRRAIRSSCCAGSAGWNWRRSPARSWRRGSAGCRSCSTASRRPPPRRCCSPPTRRRSTIASSRMSRPSPDIAFCSSGSDKRPLLDLGMRLGEASGATLALALLKAAAACHNGMATFAEAGVSGPA